MINNITKAKRNSFINADAVGNASSQKFTYHTISIKCRVPNKGRVSNKHRVSDAHIVINTGSQVNSGLLKQQSFQSISHTLVMS